MNISRIYLDWNASAPLRKSSLDMMVSTLKYSGNPSSVHKEGRKARNIIDIARHRIAEALSIDPMDITFTSGATEAATIALANRNLKSAPIEHESILAWTVPELHVDDMGIVNVINPSNSCLQLANGETGIIQDLPSGLALTDATQALGKIPLNATLFQTGLTIISSHKVGGPKGVGALLGKQDDEEIFRIGGGGQEFGRRSGTENIAGIAGFGIAVVEAIGELRQGAWENVRILRDQAEEMLKECSKDIVFFGQKSNRLPNTSCFALPNWKGDLQVIDMDLAGIAISAGSACSSGKIRSSKVLQSLGVSDEIAQSAIRLSIGPTTTFTEIEIFVDRWIEGLERRKRLIGNKYD